MSADTHGQRRRVDFARVNTAALAQAATVAAWLARDGRREGLEWVARNPRRQDRKPGSFKINLQTGRWADFATGDRGGDLISLAAYLLDLTQGDAALRLSDFLGINPAGQADG